MNALVQLATADPVLCSVCRRRAVALAYTEGPKKPLIWLCDHPSCHVSAKGVYRMPQEKLDAYEYAAVQKGGEDAGGYLDQIGQTDLTKLSAEQWQEFLRRVYVGTCDELRRKIQAGEAPF